MRETLIAFGSIACLWAAIAPQTESREPFFQRGSAFADTSCPDGKCPLRERIAERRAEVPAEIVRVPEPITSPVHVPSETVVSYPVASSCSGPVYASPPVYRSSVVYSSSCSGPVTYSSPVYTHYAPRDSPVAYQQTYTYQGPIRRFWSRVCGR
jgi:hypothetical protein